eukprot:764363-Hanusia_phi.AAC.1
MIPPRMEGTWSFARPIKEPTPPRQTHTPPHSLQIRWRPTRSKSNKICGILWVKGSLRGTLDPKKYDPPPLTRRRPGDMTRTPPWQPTRRKEQTCGGRAEGQGRIGQK